MENGVPESGRRFLLDPLFYAPKLSLCPQILFTMWIRPFQGVLSKGLLSKDIPFFRLLLAQPVAAGSRRGLFSLGGLLLFGLKEFLHHGDVFILGLFSH